MMDLSVAGLPIRVESADKEFCNRRYADYTREDGQPPVMEMTTQVLEVVPEPQGELISKVNSANVVRLADGRLCRYARTAKGEIPFAIYNMPDYTKVDIIYHHFKIDGVVYACGFSGSMQDGEIHPSPLREAKISVLDDMVLFLKFQDG